MPKPSDRVLAIKRSPLYAITELAKGLKDVIYLNIGQPDFDTPERIVEAGKRALDQGYTRYAGDQGDSELRAAISEHMKRRVGLDYDPWSEILITAGSQAGLFCSVLATINPGDEVLIFNPHYPPYVADVTLAGGKPVLVSTQEENGFVPEPERVDEKVTTRTRALIINTPNNPTGAVYDSSCLDRLAGIAKRYDLLVFSDEAYSSITYDGVKHVSIASLPGMKERTIVTNSASKPYAMPGWRVAYLAGPEHLVAQILKVHHSANIATNASAQRAFIEALRGPQDCVDEFVNEYRIRRGYVVESLRSIPGVRCTNPQGAFYVFPNISGLKLTSQRLAEYLVKEARVVTAPGIGFGAEGYIRISYAAGLSRLEEAVRRIRKAVESLP